MGRRVGERVKRSLADRFWDLPGLSWIADDCLTACLTYVLILCVLAFLAVAIYAVAR